MPYLWERLLGNTDGKGSNGGGASTSLRLHNVCIERGQIKMARCAKCNQEVTTGYVLCDRCYKKMDGIREDSIKEILGDNYDLDRLKELVQADREGKCVLLPCKVGDKLYKISENGVKEVVVQSIVFMLSHTVNHLTVHVANERGAMTEIETKDFGKTVFLTLEEAEAALEK